jgi:hypothetical protein
VRSFRIESTKDEALQEVAEAKGYTLSNLLNKLVTDYLEFSRIAEQMDSVIVSESTMRGFLSYLTLEECRENGLSLGSSVSNQMLLLGGKPRSIESIDAVIDILGEYAGWFKCLHHGEGLKGYYYIQNGLGEKWCMFLEGYFMGLVGSFGAESIIESVGDNLLLRIVEAEE